MEAAVSHQNKNPQKCGFNCVGWKYLGEVFTPKQKCPKMSWIVWGRNIWGPGCSSLAFVLISCNLFTFSWNLFTFLQSFHFCENPFNRPNWPQTGLCSFNIFHLKNIEMSKKKVYIIFKYLLVPKVKNPNIYQVPKVNILSQSLEGFSRCAT